MVNRPHSRISVELDTLKKEIALVEDKLKHVISSSVQSGNKAESKRHEDLKNKIKNINERIYNLDDSESHISSVDASILEDKVMRKIIHLLKSYPEGLTIAEIIKKLKLARHTILARLHVLVGKGYVSVRKINMAKLHFWNVFSKEPEKEIKVIPLKEEHISIKKEFADRSKPIDIESLRNDIKEELKQEVSSGKIEREEVQLEEQRRSIKKVIGRTKEIYRDFGKERVKTGIDGLDDNLIKDGIPRGANIIITGGPGSGKTTLCLQILAYHASRGKKCLYMSFDESESRLEQDMRDFGWNPEKLKKSGNLKIQMFNPFDITRSVDALLMKEKGELLIDIDPILLPPNYTPDFIVVDSLTAISSAFTENDNSRRLYIEQLFRLFNKIGATSFLITEASHIPTAFNATGAEEFLADGIIALYNTKKGNTRQKALEVIKLKGVHHSETMVSFDIGNNGIKIHSKKNEGKKK